MTGLWWGLSEVRRVLRRGLKTVTAADVKMSRYCLYREREEGNLKVGRYFFEFSRRERDTRHVDRHAVNRVNPTVILNAEVLVAAELDAHFRWTVVRHRQG